MELVVVKREKKKSCNETYLSRKEHCSLVINAAHPNLLFGPVTVTVRVKAQSRPAPAHDIHPSSLSCKAHLRLRVWQASHRAAPLNCTKSPWTITSLGIIRGAARAAMMWTLRGRSDGCSGRDLTKGQIEEDAG